jgi:hypothetical protein
MSISNLTNLKLSERHQLLLSRFHDGECGYIQNFCAKRLLSRRKDARDFIAQLEAVKECCLTHHSETQFSSSPRADIWSRVHARIEQEQRAEFYLGKRKVTPLGRSLWDRITSPYALAGGLSGAAISAAFLLVFYTPSNITTFSVPQTTTANQSQFIRPVAIDARSARRPMIEIPRISSHRPLEVDWVRSQGSLKLTPDPSGSSAIIWIRRKLPSAPRGEIAPPAIRSMRSVPSAPSPANAAGSIPQRQRLDLNSFAGTK